jgi:hypothetical protein
VIGLVLATGGHWSALQSIAWVGMAIQYSRADGLGTALQKTFDGNHPCNLCKVVQAGRQAEKEQSTIKLQTRLDLFLWADASSVRSPVFAHEPTPQIVIGFFRSDQPPTPPPRFA